MRLYLLLKTPADGADLHCQVDFSGHNAVVSKITSVVTHKQIPSILFVDIYLQVLLALNGSMGRVIMSQWLRKIGLTTLGVSEWNELTRVLRKLFHARRRENGFDAQCSLNEPLKSEVLNIGDVKDQLFIIVVDVGLLDLSTDIWREQINFLDNFSGKAKFAWMLNHDTSNAIKMELRRKGHLLMVNKPLYKAKMIHILGTVMKERDTEHQKKSSNAARAMEKDGDMHECLEIDSTHFDTASSEESDTAEMGDFNSPSTFHLRDVQKEREEIACQSQCQTLECLIEMADFDAEAREDPGQKNRPNVPFSTATRNECSKLDDRNSETISHKEQVHPYSNKAGNQQKALDGLWILLAEDTPVLQRVATIMLEKMGAKVIAVGDGLQAVEALNCSLRGDVCRRESPGNDGNTGLQTDIQESQSYDLILMDCQMPKMDGYEATKAIRKSETGTHLHIPIVALTAHAMSSDEAKCLEVGMDAYLTKPIDYKLMVSTILSLTKRKA